MSEFRQDPVSGQWVIIAPERAARPSDFPVQRRKLVGGFCPFCEGHEDRTPPEITALRRPGSQADAPGWRTRVVPNRFPALRRDGALQARGDALERRMNGLGQHEVIIESPRHVLSLSEMSPEEAADAFRASAERMAALRRDARFAYAMLFKNAGAAAGATLEHCHSQLIAMPVTPRIVEDEIAGARAFTAAQGGCVFCAMIERERRDGRRIVMEGRHTLALAPFAACFPFETWVLPKTHVGAFDAQPAETLDDLARVVRAVLLGLDRTLDSPAYNYIIHTAPYRGAEDVLYHWHVEIIPRVTQIAGFEWGTGFYINPIPPEDAAEALRRSAVL